MNNSDMPATPVFDGNGAPASTKNCGTGDIDAAYIENFRPMIGLTKREAFAMAAMQGILFHSFGRGNADELAEVAVTCADDLLKELSND